MPENAKLLLLVIAVLVAILATRCCFPADQLLLTVRVIHLLDETPVTGATVKVVSSNGRVVARQSIDDQGRASFRLPPGRYFVRMASGYTGQAEIDLDDDCEINLKVIPVLR